MGFTLRYQEWVKRGGKPPYCVPLGPKNTRFSPVQLFTTQFLEVALLETQFSVLCLLQRLAVKLARNVVHA